MINNIEIDKEELLTEFRDWLIEERDKTYGSANSYKGYVRQFFRLYPDVMIEEGLPTEDNFYIVSGEYDKLLTANVIEAGARDKRIASNNRSGFRSFVDFMEDRGYVFGGDTAEIAHEPELKNINTSYDQKALITNFRARLNTQGREYEKLILSFRVINKILNKSTYNKQYNHIMTDNILNVRFLTTNGEKLLKDVDTLYIEDDGRVSVLDKNPISKHTAFSYVYSTEGIPLIVSSMSQVSLDHSKPLFQIVEEMDLADFPQLSLLSQMIKDYLKRGSNTISLQEIRNRISSKNKGITNKLYEYVKEVISPKLLLDEIIALYEEIDIVVMHKNDNSSKNKY